MGVRILTGDITTRHVDAIVNAANSSLLGGGGVDGAIHKAAGPQLIQATRHLRATTLPSGLPPGQAVATGAFDLPATWVIHTVGPNRHAGQTDPCILERCFANSLTLALDLGVRTIAFPAIGAGVYGWAPEDVARAAHRALTGASVIDEVDAAFARDADSERELVGAVGVVDPRWRSLERIEFVAFNDAVYQAFCTIFSDLL